MTSSRPLLSSMSTAAAIDAAHAEVTQFTTAASGDTTLGNAPLTAVDQVPIVTTQDSGPAGAQASGRGGRLLSSRCFDTNRFDFASAFATGSPGVVRVYGAVRSVARKAPGSRQSSTAAIAAAVASTLPLLRPATQMRPDRTM